MATELPSIIGLPPAGYVSENYMNASIPVAEFTPAKSQFQSGLTLFSVAEDTDKYRTILGNHGYTAELPLKLAFLADNFPSDSFRNEYGANFLEKFTDVVSEGAHTIAQTFGAESATQVIGALGKSAEKQGGLIGGLGSGAESARKGLTNLGTTLKSTGGLGGAAAHMGELANKLMAGARVDFPQIWKNSAFAPSYTMTIRLFNPNPASDDATEKFIIGPLAAILTLGLPQSEGEGLYHWPFFQKIKCRGLFILDPAIITNITVVKGGDQQQIAYSQKLSMVDVRLDISGLFQTMLVERHDANPDPDRPTLAQYLNNLGNGRSFPNIYDVPNEEIQGPQVVPSEEEQVVPTGQSGGDQETQSSTDPVPPRNSQQNIDIANSLA